MKRLILIAAVVTGTSACAEFKDGNKLLSEIKGGTVDYIHANGYVIGVYDALHSVAFCPPPGVTAGQVVDMVKNYLEDSPSMRHNTADILIGRVLRSAWPCANTQRRGNSL